MRECDYISELMSLALDGELDAESEAYLKAHIAVCKRCQALWEAMNAVSAMLAQAPVLAPPLDFTGKVMQRVKREASLRIRLRLGGLLLFSAAYVEAFAFLLVWLGFMWLLWTFPAKGLFPVLVLRWTWRLVSILETLLDVAAGILKQVLPSVFAFSVTSCGIWLLVLALMFRMLRRKRYAWGL